ncbi:hypothetical protein BB559_006278, partial [Furculomyces boomerangus]
KYTPDSTQSVFIKQIKQITQDNKKTREMTDPQKKTMSTKCGRVIIPDKKTKDWCNSTTKMYSEMYTASAKRRASASSAPHSEYCECHGSGVGCRCETRCNCL